MMTTKTDQTKKMLFRLQLTEIDGQMHFNLTLPRPWLLGLLTLLATPEVVHLFSQLS
jgi:hypothetical protein